MKKTTTRLQAVLLALMLLLSLTACGQKAPDTSAKAEPAQAAPAEESPAEETPAESETTSEGTKSITLTVTYADETSDEYAITTDADFLMGAIEGTVTLEGTDGEYGFYIDSVNGVTADYDKDQAYWAIFVNDEYGNYSVDTQPVTDGDRYALVYTVG